MSPALHRVLIPALAILLIGAGVRPPGLGDVVDVRIAEHSDHVRVVIELSRPAKFETGYVGDPPRFYINIDGIWINPPHREMRSLEHISALEAVYGGQNKLTVARLVMRLDDPSREHETFELHEPFRIVTDIDTAAGRSVANARSGPLPTVGAHGGPTGHFDSRPVTRVVIDPGHGGKDPGTHGPRRLLEKDLVLRIGLELRRILRAKGLQVVMTRDRDVFVPLPDRMQRANLQNSDLFVSIHANASPQKRSHGVETYLLNTRASRQTERVAARENGTTVEKLSDLQQILSSMRLGHNEIYAASLAEKVQVALLSSLRRKYGATRDLGVKRGPFMVLFQADMPAILVEVGFLNHAREAKRMRSKGFPRAAAMGIAAGILRYRDEHARSLHAVR